MDYFDKYIKYKNKYLKLLGSGEFTSKQIIDENTKPHSQEYIKNIEYTINFLWFNRNIEFSCFLNQQYIFKFKNISMNLDDKREISIIDLDPILNIINIIKWSEKNKDSKINIWHDCTDTMVENTKELMNKLYNFDNGKLLENISIIKKIINYNNILINLNEDIEEYEEEKKKILSDEIINIYLEITYIEGNAKIYDEIKYTDKFIEEFNYITSSIKYDQMTGRIKFYKKSESSETDILIEILEFSETSSTSSLDNIYYYSITTLDRLKVKIKEKYLIEYFGLTIENSVSGNNNLPVYYRADLVRLIILLQLTNENPNSYAIYADFDTMPLDKEFLFNHQSMDLLKKYGLVLPKGQIEEYENSFHILAGKNVTNDKYMRISIEQILVEFNIQKILNNYKVSPQAVFGNYKDMFLFYFAIVLNKSIAFNYKEAFKSYLAKIKSQTLNPCYLLKLDMTLIGKLYTNEFYGPTIRVGLNLFNYIDNQNYFEMNYPIRDDLADISPHHYNYNKKYIKYKI